jgi:enoyl-CoA hydratase/carnithine racemase
MSTEDEFILYDVKDRIAYITLNRPEKLNAMNTVMQDQLEAAFKRFDLDDDAWIAILSGKGRAFCAGADVKDRLSGGDPAVRDARMTIGPPPEGWFGAVVNWKPVITAVQGHCVGLGVILALEGDLVVASETAKFAISETIRGVAAGPLWARLQVFMPSKVATEMLLTGLPTPAGVLYERGLVNRVTTDDGLLDEAEKLARQILGAAPLAVRGNVRLSRMPAVDLARKAVVLTSALKLHRTHDFGEASAAFAEKRKPSFEAR